jgi:hypothetical protein
MASQTRVKTASTSQNQTKISWWQLFQHRLGQLLYLVGGKVKKHTPPIPADPTAIKVAGTIGENYNHRPIRRSQTLNYRPSASSLLRDKKATPNLPTRAHTLHEGRSQTFGIASSASSIRLYKVKDFNAVKVENDSNRDSHQANGTFVFCETNVRYQCAFLCRKK